MLFRQTKVEDFESCALPHLNGLYRIASRLAARPSDAEDLVQETYLEAWKSFHRFQIGTNCKAWLFKIFFHRLHHYRRKRFTSKIVQESEEALEETVAYEPPVPEHVTDEEVLMALGKIPAEFRDVILLADVQEFSYKEIAETLGIPVGTVMSRLNRGRTRLRAELVPLAQAHGIFQARNEGQTR